MTNPITASAPRLRVVLSVVLLFLAISGGVVMVIGVNYLNEFASQVNQTVAEAESSSDRINRTNQEISEYKDSLVAVRLAEDIVATRESYKYQNEAYADLLALASRAGVTIEQYSFSETDPELGVTTAPKTTNPGAIADAKKKESSTDLKPTYITISLTNPVNYIKFLNFLHYIEQNLTKMQIKKVSLTSGSGNEVITDSLTVEVFTK